MGVGGVLNNTGPCMGQKRFSTGCTVRGDPQGWLGQEKRPQAQRDEPQVAVLRDRDTSPQPRQQHEAKQAPSPAASKWTNRGGRETRFSSEPTNAPFPSPPAPSFLGKQLPQFLSGAANQTQRVASDSKGERKKSPSLLKMMKDTLTASF